MLGERDFKIISMGVRQLSLPDTPGLRRSVALTVATELYALRGFTVDESFSINTFMDDCLADESPREGQCHCLGLSHRDDCSQWVLPW